MREEIIVNGIVLYATLVGEYDKRLVILTKERGKITVFANGARRPNSTLRAASQSFVMGKFTVVPGREAYNLTRVEVDEYFSDIAYDMEKMCFASYFTEFMSYYTREGDNCLNNLNLLYFTLKALLEDELPNSLIRSIYEIKLMDIEGQAIHSYSCVKCGEKENLTHFDAASGGLLCGGCAIRHKITKKVSNTLVYTLQYILSTPLNKLYKFNLSPENEEELAWIANRFRCQYVDKNFKSLEILSTLA
ncbi:MAG: DNA repair protein RecO [Lachnospiraceae bacterium]|nr:DNA repair protein RecO [Lachnospiraceae bacterium]